MSDAELPTIAILAGGLGTRLGEIGEQVPKSLIEVGGEPFAHHQLRLLAEHGARRIVYCVGHLGDRVEAAIGDGLQFGLEISYSHDPPGLAGTAGAIREALPRLGDAFMVLYGDTYLRLDYRAFWQAFERSGLPAQMAVLRNEGRWDTSNADFDGRLVTYDKRNPTAAMRWIDYGLGAYRAAVFSEGAGAEAADLADVQAELSRAGQLGGFEATERFLEIGTPESLAEADDFFSRLRR